ncbi:MAG: type II toxin-antitoxin system VapC family toxin [Candidatus Hydrogenedentes bacterium]|nr:type II toxin-antitoxin system VapC family toxin [Candidatus Hydrogenedentota bacterium]
MPRFVLDNSVVMAWCLEDEEMDYADAVLDSLAQGEALVPAVWPLEVGNALLVAERRNRLDEASLTRSLALLDSLPITVEQETPERMLKEILALARDRRLSTYDASYLDLAMRFGLPLATQDTALLNAANDCGVLIYDPKPIGDILKAD